MPEGIITLTTDFGTKDHYAGAVKGVILGINPGAVIVDITHEIEDYGIMEAAFRLTAFYSYFPRGTVHVVVVDPGVGGERKALALEAEGYFFVGPDNGVFSMIYEKNPDAVVYEITNPDFMLPEVSRTFHGRDIFAPAAAHISTGVEPGQMGDIVTSPVRLQMPTPKQTAEGIIGEVVYSDSFGNLVTNIEGALLRKDSRIYFGDTFIGGLSSAYSDAAPGEILALVGSSGFLEISISHASAARDLKNPKSEVKVIS